MEFDFIPFDAVRMLTGEGDVLFLLEIVARVLIIYIYAILLLRVVMGNQGMKNMNFLDYFVVISLGTASGDIMIYPTVPVLYCLIAITAVVLLKKGIQILNFKNALVNNIVQPKPVCVVEHGLVNFDALQQLYMRKDTLFALLRIEGVENVGSVFKAYIEPNGSISVFLYSIPTEVNGESTLPPKEVGNEDNN